MDNSPTATTSCHGAPDIKLSILLPVRNEGVNISIMLKILHAAVDVPHEALFVYDHPDDDSIPVVQGLQARIPHTRLVHNDLGPGVANAIRSGVRAARGEYVLIFAVDEVGPILAIDRMIALMNQGIDLVSCTRYSQGGRRLGGSMIGGILSRCANWTFRLLVRSPLTDATTGIKMFRRSIFDRITLEARPVGWAVAFELAIKAQLAGFKLAEVPIISIDRLYGGKSSFSLGPWMFEYLRWFLWGWRQLRKSPALPVPAQKPFPTIDKEQPGSSPTAGSTTKAA